MTRPERIPDVSPRTRANGVVVEDATLGLHAARASARVHAALVDAGTSRHAVGVGDAFGRAAELWASVKAEKAGASALPSHHLALGVGTARGGAGGRRGEGGRLQARDYRHYTQTDRHQRQNIGSNSKKGDQAKYITC